MDIQKLNQFKTWAIIALFSDDFLADCFVLKGGSALDLIYNLSSRGSIDIDVSMQDDFKEEDLPMIKSKLEATFLTTFNEHNYTIFDFKFEKSPLHQDKDRERYWGGYFIEFKIYKSEDFAKITDIDKAKRSAEAVNQRDGKTFSIDISKFECCYGKNKFDIDGFSIYVYTKEMIVYEKLRALCQQLPEYFINKGHFKKSRPRDIYDIYIIMQNTDIKFTNLNIDTLKEFFKVKKVDISYLGKLESYYDFISADVLSLETTLTPEAQTTFDFKKCFDFVISGIKELDLSK
jgi:predicted nucleotidyltransferase component of viral defense system